MKLTTLLITACFLSSCGSGINRNELQNLPSLIEIMGLDLTKGELRIRISHRNNLPKNNNQLSCQLALKDYSPIKFDQLTVPDLTNYAIETVDIMLPTSEIPQVKNNQKELPFVLDCYLYSETFRTEHLIKKSTLYKVPGSAAAYR